MVRTATAQDGLRVDEDRAWQEKFWSAQRFAWVLMALFILAALFGLTGKGGPLASATAASQGASIDYPKITRWQSDEEISLTLPASATGKVEVLFSAPFSRLFSVKSIVPEPSKTAATASGLAYTFDVGGSRSEKSITFTVAASRPVFGQRIKARVGDSKPVPIRVTVLP